MIMSQLRIEVSIAGQKIAQNKDTSSQQSTTPNSDPNEGARLTEEFKILEEQVDTLMQSLSLPGSPRPIAP